MAILLPSSYFKAAVVSTGVISVAAAMVRLSGPFVLHFAESYFPILYDNFVFFLRPPYLYLVINCIIISIVASSKLQKYRFSGSDHYFLEEEVPLSPPLNVIAHVRDGYVAACNEFVENSVRSYDRRTADNERRSPDVIAEKITADGGNQRRKPKPTLSRGSMSKETDKPLASARFGQRKAIKCSPDGGNKTAALGVVKPRRHDTLEATWKKITEGRSMPLTRHLKKSDTWEKESSHVRSSENDQYHHRTVMRSENLNDQTITADKQSRWTPPQSRRLMREPSPGQEELNRRVEAFIKKFNEEMRLQRQESLAKYQKMVSRGVLQ